MQSKKIIFVFIFLINSLGFAQTGTILGKVVHDNESIPFVLVAIDSLDIKVKSDLNGLFSIENIPFGTHQIRFVFTGYEIKNETVIIETDVLRMGDISLNMGEGKALNSVDVSHKLKNSQVRGNYIQKMENAISNVEYVGDGEMPAYNAAENLQKMPSVTIQKDQGEGRYMSVRGTPTDWNSSLINGDRLPVADEDSETRTMAFDVLSSDLLDYIKVTKALTPDMEGDAIGGAVDFTTKTSPDSFELRINLMNGYSTQAEKPLYNISLFHGSRTKDKRFGYLISGSLFQRNYGTDNFEVVYGSNFNQGINRLELRDYIGERTTAAGNIALDYTFKNKSQIYFKGLTGYFLDAERNRKTRYNYAVGAGSTVSLQHIYSRANSLLYGGEFGTNLNLSSKWKLDLKYAYYSNSFEYGNVPFGGNDERNGYQVITFEQYNINYLDQVYIDKHGNAYQSDENGNPVDKDGTVITDPSLELARVKLIGPDNPLGNGDEWDNIQPKAKQALVAEEFEFSNAYTELNTTWERDPLIAQFDLSYVPNRRVNFKYGGKVRFKEGYRKLSLHEWKQNFDVFTKPIFLTNYRHSDLDLNGGFLEELDQPYEGQFMPFLDDSFSDGFINSLGDTLREDPMNPAHHSYYEFVGAKYSYEEQVYASYLMTDYSISDKLSFIGGVRAEYTVLNMWADSLMDGDDDWFLANVYDVPNGGYEIVPIDDDPYAGELEPIKEYTVGYPVVEVQNNQEYLSFLPMLHLRYDYSNQLIYRLGLTRSFRRPNFIETKPGSPIIDFSNLEYNQGNPNLKPAYAWNADFMVEYYMPNAGIFSAGIFGKRIKDHIYRTITADIDPQTGIIYKSYQNAEAPIFLMGAEVNLRKYLDFLNGFAKNFGIETNVTFTHSEMNFPGRSFTQALPLQPKFLFNGTLLYTNREKGFNIRLAANYTGGYLMEVNTSAIQTDSGELGLINDNTEFDVFMKDKWSLDFSASYKAFKFLKLYVECTNLLNTPLYIYRGQEFRPIQVEFYGLRLNFGLKFDL
ncbi:TonB-dependent receptor [Crocinitomix catalasitica]|uniref:TonB-dependent receptor n=1 Tax=Crocinitomix catalasitica TaxID=184607 RepID=UPI000484EB80|nr:TonB-dependent receptor [Crocinitomix catalasitica]